MEEDPADYWKMMTTFRSCGNSFGCHRAACSFSFSSVSRLRNFTFADDIDTSKKTGSEEIRSSCKTVSTLSDCFLLFHK